MVNETLFRTQANDLTTQLNIPWLNYLIMRESDYSSSPL